MRSSPLTYENSLQEKLPQNPPVPPFRVSVCYNSIFDQKNVALGTVEETLLYCRY